MNRSPLSSSLPSSLHKITHSAPIILPTQFSAPAYSIHTRLTIPITLQFALFSLPQRCPRIGIPSLWTGGLILPSPVFSPSSPGWSSILCSLFRKLGSFTGLPLGPPGPPPGAGKPITLPLRPPLILPLLGPTMPLPSEILPLRLSLPLDEEPLEVVCRTGEVERCGMFSGFGCSRPMGETPMSVALPALERA